MSRNRWRFSKSIIAAGIFGLAVCLLVSLTALITGKPGAGRRMGLVDDWTTHHLIFSNPGTFAEAVAQGRFKRWYRTVNDPRYIMQQIRRKSALIGSTTNAQDFATLSTRLDMPVTDPSLSIFRGPRKVLPKRAPATQRDWAFSLGGGTVPQNMYPAKFSLNINATPDCTHDFVVYGLNVAGVEFGQANLVGLNNLYSSSGGAAYCGGTGPNVYWAYNATNEGGTVTTSPVLSLDGTKVIYVESKSGGPSYLHVLLWKAGDGTSVTDSLDPNDTLTAGLGVDSCVSGMSCMATIELATTSPAVTSSSVTNSSPFYDYNDDVVYVGDDAGHLFKVTSVLGEYSMQGTAGTWAVSTTSAVVASGYLLTGPVYDFKSGNVFVGATNGILYAIPTSTFTTATPTTLQVGHATPCTSTNNMLTDPPIVDPTNGWVYEYVTDSNTPSNRTIVEQASTAGPFTTKNYAQVGEGDSGCNSGGVFPTHLPQFDNNYYNGTVTSGHIWVCGRNGNSSSDALWEIPTSGTSGSISGVTAVENATQIDDSNSHEQCSPFTEIYNGTTDFLFFGEGLASNFTNFWGWTLSGTTATGITGSPITTYPIATGGTSGIVIDNVYIAPGWVANTDYSDGSLITDTNGNVEQVNVCSGPCESGSTAPIWTVGVLTTLSAAVTTTTATSVSVTSATGFVTGNYIFVGGSEYMGITHVSGTTLTVTRGQLGSTAGTFSSGASVRGATDDHQVVWNNVGTNQTSSLYFTTLATSSTVCTGTTVYCAIKLTQAGLK